VTACTIDVIYRSVRVLNITISIGATKITKKKDIAKTIHHIVPINQKRFDMI
jgi:hypothetical protein